jgi:hypothetical protein
MCEVFYSVLNFCSLPDNILIAFIGFDEFCNWLQTLLFPAVQEKGKMYLFWDAFVNQLWDGQVFNLPN